MARSLLDQQFVQEINKILKFGHCNPDDFVTADTERKERMKKAAVERAARDKEQRSLELKKKKQEEEDHQFACQEQERLDSIDRSSYSTMGRGRFAGDNSHRSTHSLPIPRGRGQLSEYDKEKTDRSQFYKKEIQIKKQLELTNGRDNFNNNQLTKEYWHGKQVSPLQARFYSVGAHSPTNFIDDAESSSSSSSYTPLLTSSCTTPELVLPSSRGFVQPSPCEAVRKRGNRCAAKFSNPDSDESTKNDKQIEVFMSAERSLAPSGLRYDHFPRGISINSVNPSQRIIDNELLRPEDLYSSDDSFKFKSQDFPPLK